MGNDPMHYDGTTPTGDNSKSSNQASTYPKHDCKSWQHKVWHNQADATYETCMVCGKIIKFRWKSFWKRLKGIF